MSEKNIIFYQNQSELPPPSAIVDDTTNILNIPYTVCELIVAFIAVIGNAMVIIVFLREKKLRRRTNYYIVSLAIADLLVGLLGVPFAILASIGLPTNTSICLFTISLLVVLCTISIFCLVAVSIDRYWAILYPLAYSKNVRTKTAVLIITFCWVFGCIIGFLPSFGWNAATNEHQLCLFEGVMNYDYLLFLYFGTIITPAVLMIAFYVHIYTVVIKQVSQIVTLDQIGGGGSNSSRKTSISKNNTPRSSIPTKPHSGTMLRVLGAARKREVKAAQNLSIIVLFFLICWIPLHTINCVNAFCQTCSIPELTYFCIILSHLNSAVNPLLYAYHLKDFRAALKILIMKLFGKEIPPQDPSYKFSCASQHRLPSIFEKRTSLQPRVYIDSPIWKRQQEMQKRNSLLHAPVAGSFDGVHNTVSAIAAIGCSATNFTNNNRIRTTSGDHEMWNIMEVPSVTEDCLHHTNQETKTNSLRSIKDMQCSSINEMENISSETANDQSEYFERDFTYVDADDNENDVLDDDLHNDDDEEDLHKQQQLPLFTVELQNHKQCMTESSSSTQNLFLTELPYCTGETVTNNYFNADTMNSEFDNLHERSLSLNINNNNNNNLNNNNNNNNIEQLNGYTNYKDIKIIKMDNFKYAPPNISKSATNFNLNNSNNSINNTKNNNNCCDLGVNKTSPLRIVSNLLLFTTTDQNNTKLLENKNKSSNRIRYRSRSRSDS